MTSRVTNKGALSYTLSTHDGQGLPYPQYKPMISEVNKRFKPKLEPIPLPVHHKVNKQKPIPIPLPPNNPHHANN